MKFPWYQAIYVQILIQVRSNIYDESQNSFAGLLIMTVADSLQLPAFRGKLIF